MLTAGRSENGFLASSSHFGGGALKEAGAPASCRPWSLDILRCASGCVLTSLSETLSETSSILESGWASESAPHRDNSAQKFSSLSNFHAGGECFLLVEFQVNRRLHGRMRQRCQETADDPTPNTARCPQARSTQHLSRIYPLLCTTDPTLPCRRGGQQTNA